MKEYMKVEDMRAKQSDNKKTDQKGSKRSQWWKYKSKWLRKELWTAFKVGTKRIKEIELG